MRLVPLSLDIAVIVASKTLRHITASAIMHDAKTNKATRQATAKVSFFLGRFSLETSVIRRSFHWLHSAENANNLKSFKQFHFPAIQQVISGRNRVYESLSLSLPTHPHSLIKTNPSKFKVCQKLIWLVTHSSRICCRTHIEDFLEQDKWFPCCAWNIWYRKRSAAFEWLCGNMSQASLPRSPSTFASISSVLYEQEINVNSLFLIPYSISSGSPHIFTWERNLIWVLVVDFIARELLFVLIADYSHYISLNAICSGFDIVPLRFMCMYDERLALPRTHTATTKEQPSWEAENEIFRK